jgi:hypothetical protein
MSHRPSDGCVRDKLGKGDQLVEDNPDRVVGFANQTGMTPLVAATAYLSLLTCPGVTAGTLHKLRVFRDRRRGFGNAF